MIEAKCECGQGLELQEALVGQVIGCHHCQRKVHVISAEPLAEGGGAGDFDSYLVVRSGPALVGEQFLLGGVMEIPTGKLETNPIRLMGNLVSRSHCKLERLDFGPSRWKMTDTGSRNGILVNGAKLGEAELHDGDVIKVGEYELVYRNAFVAAAPAPMTEQLPAAAPTGQVCPCCGKKMGKKAKICVACGIELKTGRPVVVSHGVDENALQVYAEQLIRLASWIIPVTPMPIPVASEAYGAHKPWTIRIVAALTVLVSIVFYVGMRSDSKAFKEWMLWPPGQVAQSSDQSRLSPKQMDRIARKLDDEEPGWVDHYAPELKGKVSEDQRRREAVDRMVTEEIEAEGITIPERAKPGEFHPWQFLTHALIHDPGWIIGFVLHLGGNMLFLLVFGTRVNALIGNIATAIIYPILAIAAAGTHMALSHSHLPMLGASGAINGLAGMYLVLFPIQRVYCAM